MALTFLIIFNLFFMLQGHPAPLMFSEEKQNVTLNLYLGIPKNYVSGKVRLEFEFGKECANASRAREDTPFLNPAEKERTSEVGPEEYQPLSKYVDCNDLPHVDPEFSGIYNITIEDAVVTVNCQVMPDGRKFLVFQKRVDGSVDFYRNWLDYAHGFGDVNGEFWLGNLHLYHLTSKSNYKLRVELESFNGTSAFAEYEHFQVGPPNLNFPLTVSGYSGTAGDSLSLHDGAQFTTEDADNDSDSKENCAKLYRGGWWYTSCYYTNLNGLYQRGGFDSGKGINWFHFMGYQNSMKSARMMITKN